MTLSELLFKLENLPADTPMTAAEVVKLLAKLDLPEPKPPEYAEYSKWDDDKLIDTKTLAAWLGERKELLETWRMTGDGPKYIAKPRYVSYRVGDVRKWLKSRTVQSTTQAQASNLR